MERKCLNCFHHPCFKQECFAENTAVCIAYETEVSRAIKSLKTDGYMEFEGQR